VAVVLPAAGGFAAPGTVSADGCVIDGLVTNSTADADVFAVIADDINDYRVVLVGRGEIELEPRHGIDPAFGVVAIRASRPATVTGSVTAVDWPAAVAAAQVALSHQLLGAAGAMLRMARDHAVGRVQFDRPISGFQAVRHRLADALVAMRAAEAATAAAWAAPSPTASIFAKALAGRAARTTAGHAQQVLGAMGFTDEHPLHRYVRRVLVLDDQFGSSRALIEQIGTEALRQRRLPDMVPLWAQP
jgi:alkylation response protein AidB-like acyl-CoA dehydrogenase